MEKNKMVKVTIEVPQSEISLLRRRFKRQQEKNPHPLHPELTDEWVVKMCFFESKSLEIQHVVKMVVRDRVKMEKKANQVKTDTEKFLTDLDKFEKASRESMKRDKRKVK